MAARLCWLPLVRANPQLPWVAAWGWPGSDTIVVMPTLPAKALPARLSSLQA